METETTARNRQQALCVLGRPGRALGAKLQAVGEWDLMVEKYIWETMMEGWRGLKVICEW